MSDWYKYFEKIAPLIEYYPKPVQYFFVFTLALVLLSIFLCVIFFYSATTKRNSSQKPEEIASKSETSVQVVKGSNQATVLLVNNSPNAQLTVNNYYLDPLDKSNISPLKGELSLMQGEVITLYDSAQILYKAENYRKSLKTLIEIDKIIKLPSVSLSMANCFLYLNELNKVIDKADETLMLLQNLSNEKKYILEFDAFNVKGIAHLERNEKYLSRTAFEKGLGIAEHFQTEFSNMERAGVINNLGVLYTRLGLFEDGQSIFNRGISLLKDLSCDDNEKLSILAMTYLNLGNLESNWLHSERIQKASNAYKKALKIYRDLNKKDPISYRYQVALTLNNYARIAHADANILLPFKYIGFPLPANISYDEKLQEAESLFLEAKQIFYELVLEDPLSYEFSYSAVLNDIGLFYQETNRIEKAEEYLRTALGIKERLAERNSGKYLIGYANCLINIGKIEINKKDYTNAERSFMTAKTIIEKHQPSGISMAILLNNLGKLKEIQNDTNLSKRFLEDSFSMSQELYKERPWAVRDLIMTTVSNLSELYKRMGDKEKSEEYKRIHDKLKKTR